MAKKESHKRKLSEREQMQRDSSREMSVFKRDDMIQKARFSLSLQEQRCILYAISRIKPSDSVFEEYTFELKDFFALCGLQKESYHELKSILLELKRKSWWVETSPNVESTVSWFTKVRINQRSGQVTIRFDDDMMPYLLQLSEQGTFYTSYSLQYVLPMGSQYSPRLYEVLKSYQKNNHQWYFEVDQLKRLLGCENYTRWPDFKRRVLEPAVKEINLYTDINIAYDTVKEGRGGKVVRVNFFMAQKQPSALLDAQQACREALDGQVSLADLLQQPQQNGESIKEQFFRENPPQKPKNKEA